MSYQPPNNEPWQSPPPPNTFYPQQLPYQAAGLPPSPPQWQQPPYQQPPMMPAQQPPMNQYQQWQVQAQFTKSYTTPAIITLVLYIFLWIPGLIANIIYLLEANKTKKITGTNPDGYGCLIAMLCVVAVPAALFGIFVMFLLFVGAIGASH